MRDTGYNAALATMFKPRKPTRNTLRKAYINYCHRKELSTAVLKEIAYRQRHSLFVAMESYRKINLGGEIKALPLEPSKLVAAPEVVIPILPTESKTIPILPPEAKRAPMAPPKPVFNYVEYSKEYRAAHRAEINKNNQTSMRQINNGYWPFRSSESSTGASPRDLQQSLFCNTDLNKTILQANGPARWCPFLV